MPQRRLVVRRYRAKLTDNQLELLSATIEAQNGDWRLLSQAAYPRLRRGRHSVLEPPFLRWTHTTPVRSSSDNTHQPPRSAGYLSENGPLRLPGSS